MKAKFLTAAVLAAAALAAQAAPAPAPESAQCVDPQSQLLPTEQDYAKAREDRRKMENRPQKPAYVSPYNTKIEETYDNNRLVEVKVTPGSTEIPYTMSNRADKPVDNAPGQDPHNTLGTPKFFHFDW